jgi:hypothetical protein
MKKFKQYENLISGFRSDVDEICGLLGYYTASCDNCLPTIHFPETSVNNYHTTPCNNTVVNIGAKVIFFFNFVHHLLALWNNDGIFQL